MKKYVTPEMEIDLFEENSGLHTEDSGMLGPQVSLCPDLEMCKFQEAM